MFIIHSAKEDWLSADANNLKIASKYQYELSLMVYFCNSKLHINNQTIEASITNLSNCSYHF